MLDIIIFAAIATYILVKLFQALGDKRYESPKQVVVLKPKTKGQTIDAKAEKNLVQPLILEKTKKVKEYSEEEEKRYAEQYGQANWTALKDIQKVDSEFTPELFIEGAKGAFELVLKAYSQGDKTMLKSLTSAEIYKRLTGAIDKLAASGRKNDNTLISILDAEIEQVSVHKKKAMIRVKFVSEQVLLVRDISGQVVEGDVKQIDHMTDRWEFERILTSSDPNWVLIATHKD